MDFNTAYLEERSLAIAEDLLHEDSYYEYLATPLKSAKLMKMQEKQELVEFLQFKPLHSNLQGAEELIRSTLSGLVSDVEYQRVIVELNDAVSHYFEKIDSLQQEESGLSESAISQQNLFGISDDTLMHVYTLMTDFVKKNEFEKAISLLIFLEVLAPYVSSYWVAHGVCLQALQKDSEALQVFEVAKLIDPGDPEAYFYSIECYKALHEKDRAKDEIAALMEVVERLEGDKKVEWRNTIKNSI